MLSLPNAGGSSLLSEVLSFEMLSRAFGATLDRTEMELTYVPGAPPRGRLARCDPPSRAINKIARDSLPATCSPRGCASLAPGSKITDYAVTVHGGYKLGVSVTRAFKFEAETGGAAREVSSPLLWWRHRRWRGGRPLVPFAAMLLPIPRRPPPPAPHGLFPLPP